MIFMWFGVPGSSTAIAVIQLLPLRTAAGQDAARLQAAVSVWIGGLRTAGELRRECLPDDVRCESQEGALCTARLHEKIQVRDRPAEAGRGVDRRTLAARTGAG